MTTVHEHHETLTRRFHHYTLSGSVNDVPMTFPNIGVVVCHWNSSPRCVQRESGESRSSSIPSGLVDEIY